MPPTIWIIDDDLVSLYATRYRIQQSRSDTNVLDFDSSHAALAAYYHTIEAEGKLPDIIFLDLIMPGMSGWEFLDAIAKASPLQGLPEVYVLSAFSNTKDRNRAKEHNAIRGHFDKPLSRLDMDRTLLTFSH